MPRALILVILATAFFGGIATENTASAGDSCPDTGTPVSEVAPSKSVRSGDCYVTKTVDHASKTVTITFGQADEDFVFMVHDTKTTSTYAWIGYPSVTHARVAACTLKHQLLADPSYSGYKVLTEFPCWYRVFLMGVVR